MSVSAAASWMLTQFNANGGTLSHHNVVAHLGKAWGGRFTYIGSTGELFISRSVLDRFRTMSGDQVVWDLSGQYWRRRRPGDKPGRSQ